MCWNDGTVYRGQWRNNVYDGRGWHLEGKNWGLADTIYSLNIDNLHSIYVKSMTILKYKANTM